MNISGSGKQCRACIEESDSFRFIFEIHKEFGTNYSLADMIMSACPTVNISLNDGLPDVVCTQCSAKLLEIHKFRLKIEHSESILRSALSNSIEQNAEADSEVLIKQEILIKTEFEIEDEFNQMDDFDPRHDVLESGGLLIKEEESIDDPLDIGEVDAKHLGDEQESYENLDTNSENAEEFSVGAHKSIMEGDKKCSTDALKEKTKKKYNTAYKVFMDWKTQKKIVTISEKILLEYFRESSEKYKSTSLWSLFSMLKSTLKINDNINMDKYHKLTEFLKNFSNGYTPRRAKTFTPVEVNTFILEAPDYEYLATKVALILGVMGACRANELHAMKVEDFEDHESSVTVTVTNANPNLVRTFTVDGTFYFIYKKYVDLRPVNLTTNCFFINYQRGKCTTQRIGINKFGSLGRQIATFLKLPNPEMYTGHSVRKTSSILLVNAGRNIFS